MGDDGLGASCQDNRIGIHLRDELAGRLSIEPDLYSRILLNLRDQPAKVAADILLVLDGRSQDEFSSELRIFLEYHRLDATFRGRESGLHARRSPAHNRHMLGLGLLGDPQEHHLFPEFRVHRAANGSTLTRMHVARPAAQARARVLRFPIFGVVNRLPPSHNRTGHGDHIGLPRGNNLLRFPHRRNRSNGNDRNVELFFELFRVMNVDAMGHVHRLNHVAHRLIGAAHAG